MGLARALGNEALRWGAALLRALPGRCGRFARAWWLRRRLRGLGEGPLVEPGVVVEGGERVTIGDRFSIMSGGAIYANDGGSVTIGRRVSLNRNVLLDAAEGGAIEVGDDVLIGPNAVVRASDHEFSDLSRPIREQGHRPGRVVIEDDVWIGANAVLVAGVRVGAHAIVGAGAVVTHDVPPLAIVGGAPARVIGRRGEARREKV